jgi:hypothetical protein
MDNSALLTVTGNLLTLTVSVVLAEAVGMCIQRSILVSGWGILQENYRCKGLLVQQAAGVLIPITDSYCDLRVHLE